MYIIHYTALTKLFQVNEDVESEDFEPQVIIDAAMSDSEMKILTNIMVDSRECRFVGLLSFVSYPSLYIL